MKKTILFIYLLFALGCSKNTDKEQEFDIIGKWQLIETFTSTGGSQPLWVEITDGYIYDFKIDETFTRNKSNSNCLDGTYTLNNDILTITTNCSSNGASSISYKLIYEKGNIILKPSNTICIEGCGDKFIKVK